MKKINHYSAQFKFVQKPVNTEGASRENYNNIIHTQQSCPSVQSTHSAFGAFGNNSKKKLSKQNQEILNKISASGFKQFHKI